MLKIVFAFVLISHAAIAQKISIEGILTDSTGRPLPSATVLLLNPADSTLLHFAPTDSAGQFFFSDVSRQPYLLRISYVGYAIHTVLVDVGSVIKKIELGRIVLREQTRELSEVIVSGQKVPVVIKRDTIEFNASSFKTKENAIVEDLLKKLPGVEVDNDGTIRAQGKKVERVTVDGKNFFGNDPKLATRNLPADAIDKVQVFDKKSDQAQFTGIDDGQKEKTINLALKEEKRKGAFGELSIGGGSEDRYQAKASINKFSKEKQLSFLGMANNINEQGFGIEDYMNFTGGSQAMMSGRGQVRIEINDDNQNGIPLDLGNRPNGVMSSLAGGANFNRDLSKKTEFTSSYFYNRIDHITTGTLLRENFFTNGKLNYNESSDQDNLNNNHRLNFSVDHKLDSMNSVKLNTVLSYNETAGLERSNASTIDDDGNIINSSERERQSDGNTARISSSLLWRHRFTRKGRTLSANLQYSASASERLSTQDLAIFDGETEDQFLQDVDQEINNKVAAASVNFTEPLGKRKYLEANCSYRINKNAFSREVFDLLENAMLRNDSISSAYSSEYEYHRAGLNFRMNRKQFTFTVGAALQNAQLDGAIENSGTAIGRSFTNLLPALRFNYNFTDNKDLSVEFETSVDEPGIQQLQPVVDNSDPLNLYVGNPELRPSYSRNVRANFGLFNPLNFISFQMFLESTLTTDAIAVSQSVNERGVRTSKPVNVADSRGIMSHVSFGFPLEKLKSRVSLSSNIRHQQGLTFIDDAPSETIENMISGRIRYDLTLGEIFDLGLMANVSRQTATYELSPQADQLFFNNSFTADFNLIFLKNFSLNSAFEYLSYRNSTNGFSQDVPLLNVSVSRFILKAKSGEIKLAVINALDRSVGISQSTGLNYVERRQTNALGRYVMVSFIYALNKQLNPLGMRPRGRVMRVIR